MKHLLFKTDENSASFILRMTIGIIVLIHGIPKLGAGFTPFVQYITDYLQLPAILAYATIFIEIIGSVMLIIGFATRINAMFMLFLFIGMILTVHGELGFMMNWFGTLEAGQEGYEYHIVKQRVVDC